MMLKLSLATIIQNRFDRIAAGSGMKVSGGPAGPPKPMDFCSFIQSMNSDLFLTCNGRRDNARGITNDQKNNEELMKISFSKHGYSLTCKGRRSNATEINKDAKRCEKSMRTSFNKHSYSPDLENQTYTTNTISIGSYSLNSWLDDIIGHAGSQYLELWRTEQ